MRDLFCMCEDPEHGDFYSRMIRDVTAKAKHGRNRKSGGYITDLFTSMFTEWCNGVAFGSTIPHNIDISDASDPLPSSSASGIHSPLFGTRTTIRTAERGGMVSNDAKCISAETMVMLQYFKLFSMLQRLYVFESMDILFGTGRMDSKSYINMLGRIYNPHTKEIPSVGRDLPKFVATLGDEKATVKNSIQQLRGILIGTLPTNITEPFSQRYPMSFMDYWLTLLNAQLFLLNIGGETKKYKGTSLDTTRILNLVRMTAVIEANLSDVSDTSPRTVSISPDTTRGTGTRAGCIGDLLKSVTSPPTPGSTILIGKRRQSMGSLAIPGGMLMVSPKGIKKVTTPRF